MKPANSFSPSQIDRFLDLITAIYDADLKVHVNNFDKSNE